MSKPNTTSTTKSVPDKVAKATEDLRDAASVLRDAVSELHNDEDEAWERYRGEIDDALAHMDAQLDVSTAQIKAARAETREDLADALHQAAEAPRELLEQLRVQSHLGAMDARDRVQSLMDDVTGLGKHLETVVDSVLNDSKKTVKDLTNDANEAIAHLRKGLRDLPSLF